MDELSNEELFNSALSDEIPEAKVTAEAPEPEQREEGDTRARDDQGRFVAKTEEPEAKPDAKQEVKPVAEQKDEAQIPSWRLREIREERDALRVRLAALQSQPKAEPIAKPDIFEKPDEFVRSNIQEALTPIEQKFSSFIETVSRRDAVREHGEERLTQAYSALDQAAKSGDPQALAIVQSVKQSMQPYQDIVGWYADREASLNPEAFFQRKLEEKLADEKFKGELMAKLQPAQESVPAKPVFKIPPSLNRAAAAAPVLDDGGDLSNESLFANALR